MFLLIWKRDRDCFVVRRNCSSKKLQYKHNQSHFNSDLWSFFKIVIILDFFKTKLRFFFGNNKDLFTFGPVLERLWILVTKIKIQSIDLKYCWRI